MRPAIKLFTILFVAALAIACADDRSVFQDAAQANAQDAQQVPVQQPNVNLEANVPVVDGVEIKGTFRIVGIYLDVDSAPGFFNGVTIDTEIQEVLGTTDGEPWVSAEDFTDEELEGKAVRPVLRLDEKYSRIVFNENGTFGFRYKFVDEDGQLVQLGDLDNGKQNGYFTVEDDVVSFEVKTKDSLGIMDGEISDYYIDVFGDEVSFRAVVQNQDVGRFVIIMTEKI